MTETPVLFCARDAKYVLVVEREVPLAKVVAAVIWGQTGKTPLVVHSVEDSLAKLERYAGRIFAVAVGLDVPDVNDALEATMRAGVPSVVYGHDLEDEQRRHLATLGIVDVVLGRRHGLPELVGLSLNHLVRNMNTTILVADDSRSMRSALQRFLCNRCYRTILVNDGRQALDALRANPEVKLVITDNEMPGMDGFSLVKEIRKDYTKDDLAVIGMSGRISSALSVRFINNGANDFLHKPFQKEELYCRVEHNLEMLNRIEIIRDLSYRDPLTRLHNRRYFFENADEFMRKGKGEGKMLCVAMIDIDHFKAVNDNYGHDGGDTVLKAVSSAIAGFASMDAIVSRFGGEEFCVLSVHDKRTDVEMHYDMLRKSVEQLDVVVEDQAISVTVSIGYCTETDTLNSMLKLADSRLYTAKETGRNKVVGPPPESHVRDMDR